MNKKPKVKLTIKLDSKMPVKSLASPLMPPTAHISHDEDDDLSAASTPTNGSFKTVLPPRKRARTKEEKEQRRVERILRNRRAAHLSREKKKKYIEFLENGILELINGLTHCEKIVEGSIDLIEKDTAKTPEALSHLKTLKQRFNGDIKPENTNEAPMILEKSQFEEILDKISQNKSMSSGRQQDGQDGHVEIRSPTATNYTGAVGATGSTSTNNSVSNGSTPASVASAPQNPCIITQTINNYIKTQKHCSNPSTPRTGDAKQHWDDSDDEAEAAASSLQKLSRTPVGNSSDVITHKPVNGLGIAMPVSPEGRLLDMNAEMEGEGEEEEEAIKIMMSLKREGRR